MKKLQILSIWDRLVPSIEKYLRVMKFTVLLSILGICQAFAISTYSQTTRLTFDVKNTKLKAVLTKIEAETEFYFLYSSKLVDVEKNVNVKADNLKIDEILDLALKGSDIDYSIVDKQIILSPKSMMNASTESVSQQQKNISGKVTDQTGVGIPGAAILVKGTTTGVVTDSNGNYTIANIQNNATLQFSFVGMKSQEISTENQTTINVTLYDETIGLEEVVAIGYGTKSKKTLTGAVSSLQSDALTTSISPSVSTAMIGKIAGITTRLPDGRPGASATLQIRSMGTPLYVIDGIPATESDFNNIDMNDIESISVLKDASAAIYGLRAANGVVLTTTKLGKSNAKTRIEISGYSGWQNFTRYPKQANAYQYELGLAESAQNLGTATAITQAELDKWKAGGVQSDRDYRSFDYLDYMINPSPQSYINASATGGSEKFNYHFSLGNLDQRATIASYYFKRNNIQANLEAKLATGFKIGTQISGRIETRHQAGVPGDDYNAVFNVITRNWPTERPYANDNPLYINNTHSININPATYVESVTGWNTIVNRVVKANFYAEYDFKFGLKARGTYSYQYTAKTDDDFEYTYNAYTYNKPTDTYNMVVGGGNQNPIRRTERWNTVDNFSQFQLSYDKTFDKHYISAVAAYESYSQEATDLYIHALPPNNYIPTMLFANQDVLRDLWTQQARASYIGRLNYNFNGKYLVEILGRYDGSYMYSADNRWGFFPGVSVGWRISEEPFFKSAIGSIISDFKLRASYGKTGSETGVTAFGYLGGYNWAVGSQVFDGTTNTGIQPRGMPVTNLSWITNISSDIGFDFSLFNNKISGQFDVFERKVTGIPAAKYDVLLPSEVGYTLPNENLNSTANVGLEGILFYKGKVGDLKYSIGINGTLARAKDLQTYKPRYGNSWDEYRNSTKERWSNISWGYNIIGQFQNQEQIDNYPVNIDGSGNRTLLPGDLIYNDLNGDKIINTYDMKPIGYSQGANPYMNFGLTSTFEYKNVYLNIDFAGATMETFIRNNELKIPFAGTNDGNSPEWLLTDRWHRVDPFDASSAWIPGKYPATRKNLASHSNFNKTNDFYLTNVNYFRMRNFELGYTYPLKFIKKEVGSKIRIYTNISNLFSIDNVGKKFGIDPEISNTGGLAYPQTRVYNFGFVLSL